MVDVSAISLSGLYANERKLAVAADNIANANTDGYQAKDVKQTSLTGGGVATQVVNRNSAPQQQSGDTGSENAVSNNVSLEEELVSSKLATYGAQANLKVLQAQDKLNKYLLDIQA